MICTNTSTTVCAIKYLKSTKKRMNMSSLDGLPKSISQV